MRRALCAVLAAAATLLGLPEAARGRLVDGIVAVVNGEPVTYSEVLETVAETLGIPVGDADIYLRQEKEAARVLGWIGTLVEAALVRQELARLGASVAEQEVDRAVESVRKTNGMTEEQFREALAREGLSVDAYRRRIRWQLERGAIVRAKKWKDVTITDEELRAFYQEHAERFLVGARVRVASLFFPLPAEGPDREAAAVRARIAAKDAADLLREGRSMEETAKILAPLYPGVEAVESGWVEAGDLAPEIRKEIGRLRTGEASPPFFTEAGGHIVMVLGRRGGEAPEFGQILDALAEELTDRRSEKAFADILSELKAAASIDVRL